MFLIIQTWRFSNTHFDSCRRALLELISEESVLVKSQKSVLLDLPDPQLTLLQSISRDADVLDHYD